MSEPDEERRYRALRDLPGGNGLLERLLAGLADDSWRVRKIAVDRLVTEVSPHQVLPGLVAALGDEESASLRNSAMEALVRIGEPAIEKLGEVAAGEGAELRKFAVDAIGAIGSAGGVVALERALRDPDANVRLAAIEALGKVPVGRATRRLLDVLIGAKGDERLAALDSLSRARANIPFEVLADLMRDRRLRRPVVRSLAHSDDPRALGLLIEALGDGVRGTREAALAALGVQATRGLVPAVGEDRVKELLPVGLAALASDDPAVAAGAAGVLGALGRPGTVVAPLAEAAVREELRPALRRALVAQGDGLLDAAAATLPLLPAVGRALVFEALMDLGAGGRPLPGASALALPSATASAEEFECLSAMELLSVVGGAEAIGPLAALVSETGAIAMGAERALVALASRAPVPLRQLCRARLRTEGRRASWLRILGVVGTEEDVALVEAVAEGGEPEERCAALDALSALDPTSRLDTFELALQAQAPVVRAAALRGLARQGAAALHLLAAALADGDEDVACLAAESLAPLPGAGPLLAAAFRREHRRRSVVALALLRAAAVQEDAIDDLLDEAMSGDPELLKEALRAAVARKRWPLLHRHAQHPRWDVRCLVAGALRREGGEPAIALLEEMRARETNALAAEEEAAALDALRASPAE